MKQALFIASITAMVASSASAAIIAQWDIPSSLGTSVGTTYTVGLANAGDQTAGSELKGVHALAATTWTSPAGNASAFSFSSNNWTAGDYYQFTVSTASYSTIAVSFDSTRSGTGPGLFDLVMSIDGGATFTTLLASQSVAATSWSSGGVRNPASLVASAAAGAENLSSVIFRWRSLSTTAAGGTSRIDNVQVTGELIPAPGALALLGAAGLLGVRRRRA